MLQITKIKNENGNIPVDSTEINRIVNTVNTYANKWNNLYKVNKFLDTQNLPKLNHEEVGNLSRLNIIRRLYQ